MEEMITRHPIKTSLAFAATAAMLLLGSAGQAFAHAHPVHESPAAGSAVSAPAEVSISYTEPLEAALSHLKVVDAHGKQVNEAKSSVDGKDRKTLGVALPKLAGGRYKVEWAVVADDGHRTHGEYTFTVK